METVFLESIYTNSRLIKAIARKRTKNQTESIYFILTDTKTDVGKMIQKVLNVDYNHISLSFEDNFNEVYGFGTNRDDNESGFIIERFDAGAYRDNDGEYLTLEMKITPSEKKKIKDNLQYYIENHKSFKFNKIGLVSNAIGVPFNPGDAFFCSQFIAKLFQDSGIKLFDKSYGLVRPSDFLYHPSMKVKHKGYIRKRLKYESKNNIRKQAFFLK